MILNNRDIMLKNGFFSFEIKHPTQAPACPGCYFFIWGIDGEMLSYYIGSSQNLRGRLTGHEIWRKLKREGFFYQIYILPLSIKDYLYTEILLIDHFKPIYNKRRIAVTVKSVLPKHRDLI